MAEAFLKNKLITTTSEIEVFSAGTNAKSNLGATKEAIKVMELEQQVLIMVTLW